MNSPELDNVRQLPWHWRQLPISEDHVIYWEGTVDAHGGSRRVVAAAASRMGLPAMGVAASKVVARFRPRYLASTGICAGVRNKTRVGHVIIPDPVWDYGSGKWVTESRKLRFLPSAHQLPLNVDVRGAATKVAQAAIELAELRSRWPADKPDGELVVHVGPFASGAAVLADGDTIAKIGAQHRNLLGVDMEAYALHLAAEESSRPRPVPFVVKCVVDHADSKKSDDFQRYGAFISAQVLRALIEKYLPFA